MIRANDAKKAHAYDSLAEMVEGHNLSVQAAAIVSHVIYHTGSRGFEEMELPATAIRHVLNTTTPATGYKYIKECVESDVLIANKEKGGISKYKVNLDVLLSF